MQDAHTPPIPGIKATCEFFGIVYRYIYVHAEVCVHVFSYTSVHVCVCV